MANLQHKLADLTESASPGSHPSKTPLAFLIYTEGPQLELWVHYTTLQHGGRMYNMNIHASLVEGVAKFLMVVNKVMSWANIVEQLVLLEGALQR